LKSPAKPLIYLSLDQSTLKMITIFIAVSDYARVSVLIFNLLHFQKPFD